MLENDFYLRGCAERTFAVIQLKQPASARIVVVMDQIGRNLGRGKILANQLKNYCQTESSSSNKICALAAIAAVSMRKIRSPKEKVRQPAVFICITSFSVKPLQVRSKGSLFSSQASLIEPLLEPCADCFVSPFQAVRLMSFLLEIFLIALERSSRSFNQDMSPSALFGGLLDNFLPAAHLTGIQPFSRDSE